MTTNILLIGKTGSGKSSLGNVLLNKNNNFTEVFAEGSGSTSTTKIIQKDETPGYQIIDTPQEFTKEEFTKVTSLTEVDYCFIQIGGRKDTNSLSSLLEKALSYKGKIVIVRTRFDEFEKEEECQKDLKTLKEETPELAEIINSNVFFHVDNPKINFKLYKGADKTKEERVNRINEERAVSGKQARTESHKILLEKITEFESTAKTQSN